MQTRSSLSLVSNPSSNPTLSTNPNPKGRNRRRSKQRIKEFNLDELSPPIVMMTDQRTMAQLLQAPTEGYEDTIVVLEITANNFELKHGLLTLVQNKQFFGHDKEDPHAHIRYFNKITSTLKFSNIPNTWDDLVLKFINQFFPPSKTTNLRNEITNFQQRFDKSFSEAWDRFKDLLRACPHHALLLDKKSQNQAPATVKAVEESCVTYGGAHYYLSIAGTTSTEQPPLKNKSMWSDQEKRIQKIDRLARSLLIQGLSNDTYSLIDSNKTAKDLWDALARHMLSFEYGEQDRKAAVLYEYEMFKANEGELLLDTYI
nr:reverse transcriptase domain-containing protein [Tanacetum cinerariifolium]